MRSFVAILAAVAALQGGLAAPFGADRKSGHPHATITQSFPGGFPYPTSKFQYPTSNFPHHTGSHHPEGHHSHSGSADPTGGAGRDPHHEKDNEKPYEGEAEWKKPRGHKPWGHGTAGFPHTTKHHPSPTGGFFPHPTDGPHSGERHHPKRGEDHLPPIGISHHPWKHPHKPYPSGGFPPPTPTGFPHPRFPHPTGGSPHSKDPEPSEKPSFKDEKGSDDSQLLREREILQRVPRVVRENKVGRGVR
ncbi:hypothetical protein AAE478_010149 [Parahypoxylon ruwenzoriense]